MSILNQVISSTKSFQAGTEGKNVAVFISESESFQADIEELGFKEHFTKDTATGRMIPYGHFVFDGKGEFAMIFVNSKDNSFTMSIDTNVVEGY